MSFQRIETISNVGFSIIDTDFTVVVSDKYSARFYEIFIIKEYAARGLSVGKNLSLFVLWYIKQYNGSSLENAIEFQSHPLFYEDLKLVAPQEVDNLDKYRKDCIKYIEEYGVFA